MSETEFDKQLNASSPATTPPSESLNQLLQDIAASRVRKRTLRWRVGVSTVLSLALVGGTSAALASPLVQEWFEFNPDRTIPYNGGVAGECIYAFEVHGDPLADQDALAIAEAVIDDLEITESYVREAVVASREALTELDPNDPALVYPAGLFETRAVSGAVIEDIYQAVEAAGFQPTGLYLSGDEQCLGEPE